MTKTLSRLGADASAALRDASRAEGAEHTAAMRTAAERIVDARGLFSDSDGLPDWRGRSYDYRRWIGDVYGQAGLPASELPRLQASVRYHVSNVLRDRLDPATLDAMGLREIGARGRAREQRAEKSAILSAVTGSGLSTRDALMALGAAEGLLKRLTAEDLHDLPAEGRKAARALLRDVSRHADRLAEGTKARRG